MTFQLIATLCAAIFTGAAISHAAGDLDRARVLLDRWNRLHAVRSALSLSALVTFLVLLR